MQNKGIQFPILEVKMLYMTVVFPEIDGFIKMMEKKRHPEGFGCKDYSVGYLFSESHIK